MTDTLKVLVWGHVDDGPCAYFRGYQYDAPLRELGVEMRHLTKVDTTLVVTDQQGKPVAIDGWSPQRFNAAIASGEITAHAEVNKDEIEWADVVVFRRYYNTTYKCGTCSYLTHDSAELTTHPHPVKPQDNITRLAWPAFRDAWTGGIVYETDDDHFEIKNWNGYYKDVMAERDLIVDMVRRADVVTTSTPVIARRYSRYNPRVRVVRNAIDPELYTCDTPRTDPRTRLVYYGSTARLRDYAGFPDERGRWRGGYAMAAVNGAAQRYGLWRVFFGTNEGTESIVAGAFDEQYGYIEGIAAFSKALANSHGDIGIAPLGGDDFDQAKSELHWLEYAVCGMAFVGERFHGDGPYAVVRHGVDGLLARGAQQWHDAVASLVKSKDLRDELAGRARERVLAEYDYRKRAEEWAAAFRFAAENPGIGARKDLVAA